MKGVVAERWTPQLRVRFLLTSVFACSVAAGCGTTRAVAVSNPGGAPAVDPVAQLCERFFTAWRLGAEADATAMFDLKMKQALPSGELARTWNKLTHAKGKLVGWRPVGRDEPAGKDRRTYDVAFESGAVRTLLVFDPATREMVGLFFTSSPAASQTEVAVPELEGRFTSFEIRIGQGAASVGATVCLPRAAAGKAVVPGQLGAAPGAGAPFPGVVLVAGSGPLDRDETVAGIRPFRDLAQGLAARGIVTLRFDKRTHAHPDQFLNRSYTIDDEIVSDAVEAVRALRELPEVDRRRVFILGHSLGAWMAPQIGLRGGPVAGLLLVGVPGRPLPELIVEQLRRSGAAVSAVNKADAQVHALAAGTLASGEMVFGAPVAYWSDLAHYDPFSTAVRLGRPILLARGASDWNVTAEDQAEWRRRLGQGVAVDEVTFAGLGHVLVEATAQPAGKGHPPRVPDDVIDRLASFISGTAPVAASF